MRNPIAIVEYLGYHAINPLLTSVHCRFAHHNRIGNGALNMGHNKTREFVRRHM